jgi:hypothetical protein
MTQTLRDRLVSVTGRIDSDTGSAWKQLRDKSPTVDYLFAPGKRYSVELLEMVGPVDGLIGPGQ